MPATGVVAGETSGRYPAAENLPLTTAPAPVGRPRRTAWSLLNSASSLGADAQVMGQREAALAASLSGLQVEAEIARRANSIVYRARHGGRTFAVKLLTDAGDRRETLLRLRREASALARLHHPALPTVVALGELPEGPYLVMEHVEGEQLRHRLESGPLAEAQIARLGTDIASALGEVHRHGLVHRDVKPENVLIDGAGAAKLIDFGFAIRMAEERPPVAGTFLYSAPEQTGMLRRPVDGRADLYALGLVLYYALTGRPLYESETSYGLLLKAGTGPGPEERVALERLPAAFVALFKKAWAPRIEDRFQSAREMAAHVEPLVGNGGEQLHALLMRLFGDDLKKEERRLASAAGLSSLSQSGATAPPDPEQ